MSFQVSEYVSPGHPDKTADAISSYLLDRYLEKDKSVRFAVETLVKERDCVLAGELTSHIEFRKDEIAKFAKAQGFDEYQLTDDDLAAFEEERRRQKAEDEILMNQESEDEEDGIS